MADYTPIKIQNLNPAENLSLDDLIPIGQGDRDLRKSKILNLISQLNIGNNTAPKPIHINDADIFADGSYVPVEEGEYSFLSPPLIYDASEGLTFFYKLNDSWFKNVTPIDFTPSGEVVENDPNAVSGGEVYKKTVLNDSVFTSVFDEAKPYEKLPVLKSNNEEFNFNQEYFLANEFHRPDLSNYNVFIDSQDHVISYDFLTESSGGGQESISFTDLYYNPAPQEPYNIGSSGTEWINANLYHELWLPFLNDTTYVTRELLGVSSERQLNIYKYEFKPENPTRKVVFFAGNHGPEKIPVIVLYRFFKNLIENYSSSPALQWARKNIHFVVVPLLSPDGYELRCRRVKETAPFNASWTKTGNVATITFNTADFPNTNPNLTASTYFSNNGIVGKTMISLIDSSDTVAIPNDGYLIQSNPSGQSVTINVPTGGASSGTCKIYVSTDPNRNYSTPNNSWEAATPNGTITPYTEPVAVRMDNKGTKAYSLTESLIAKKVIDDNQDATFLIDFHNGSADYDSRWDNISFDRSGLDQINDLHRLYTNQFLDRIIDLNALSPYASQTHSINAITVEWGQHSPITVAVATDSQRWFGNLMISGSWYYNKKL